MEPHSVIPENIEALAAEYNRVSPLIPGLHARIAKLAGKEAIRACAKRLGMLGKKGGKAVIAFEHEMEAELFQDYLIYMYRPRGFSLAMQMHNRKAYPPGSDEHQLLAGMAQARFSLFWIRELHPSGGVVVLDIVRGEELFVLDQSLPQQDVVGMLLAFRIFPLRNAWMHTGASMAFGKIEDNLDLQPMGRTLNEREERELNEVNIQRWRAFLQQTA